MTRVCSGVTFSFAGWHMCALSSDIRRNYCLYCTVATLGDIPCPEGLVAVAYFPGCPMSRRGCRLRIWALNRLLSQEMILAGLWTFCKGSFRPRKPPQDRQVTDPIQILASCGLCPRVSHVPEGLSPVVPPFTQSRAGTSLRLRSRRYSTCFSRWG